MTDKMSNVKLVSLRNRRYLGNKYKLLEFIHDSVNNSCHDINSMIDIFAGTGAVAASFASSMPVITNDILYSNYLCNLAWLSPEPYDKNKIVDIINQMNDFDGSADNYVTDNFADTYFSRTDCSKIGESRELIEALHSSRQINEREFAILVASLLYGMDKIAKTVGHYDAYRKGVQFDHHLDIPLLNAPTDNNQLNCCYNEDANTLIQRIDGDLLYLDPPYNSRQYGDAYHLLENIARWEKPTVTGVARKMNRDSLKSAYCTVSAVKAFDDLVTHANVKYIVMSYNSMAKKGNARSNAKIDDCDIINILSKIGNVTVAEQKYKAFTTGKSSHNDNAERLFICEVNHAK